MARYYVVVCYTSYDKHGESSDIEIVKVFTDKEEAEKYCSDLNETASHKEDFDQTYRVEESE